MNNYQRVEGILKHMKMVESNMQKIAKKLWPENKPLALTILKNSRMHDLSKFNQFEFDNLNEEVSPELFQQALEMHHEFNSHHPEHYASIHNMKTEDIIEMVCDCLARAQEFGTNVEDYFRKEMTKKHGFQMSDPIGVAIQEYLDMLLDTRFKKK